MTLGGAERYLIDLANSLVSRGIEVTMAFGGSVMHKPGPVEQVKHLEVNRFTKFGKLGPFRLLFDWPIGVRFGRYLRENKVDIINTVMLDTGIWAWFSGRMSNIPVFHTPMHAFCNYSRQEKWLIGTAVGANIIKALKAKFIAVSDYLAWELSNLGNISVDNIYTSCLGVDIEKFKPTEPDKQLIEEFNLSDESVIGTIGRLYHVKGCHKVIASMPSLLQIYPNTKLVLVGDGPERENLERQARELNVQNNVVFTGWRTDTNRFINIFDIYIVATDGPNLGLSALQAMAQYKPLVCYAKDQLEQRMASDTVNEGINGHIVPVSPPDEAGAVMGQMLKDAEELKKMGLESRRLAESKFDWNRHVSNVIDIYNSCLR